jgi:hypothetical protein
MKQFKNIFSIIILAMVLIIASCKKLDEKPLNFVAPEQFYNTPSQIKAVFAASVNRLWTIWEGYSYPGLGYFSHDDQVTSYSNGDLVIGNNFASDLWDRHYAAIRNLNTAIGAMKNGSLKGSTSQGDIDELIAEAKFLRGFNYFMLVRMFGDLPLITEDSPDPITSKITRSPVAEVYQLIVSDFTEAAAKLPSAPLPPSQQGVPTSGAAKGLLAKVYLTMATAPLNDVSNYPKAADYAGQVIQEGKYSLVTDINKVFSIETKYGPENMWSFNSNYQDQYTSPQVYKPGSLGGWANYRAEIPWEQKYPESPRKKAFLLTEINGVPYTQWPEHAPFIKKFMQDAQTDYEQYVSVMNMPVIRYADVLLIYAEAVNMANNGPTQAAVDAINQVIDRSNAYQNNPLHPRLTTNMSKVAFDSAVVEERNLELCFELGDRWFDLIRKRILKEKSDSTIQKNFTEADYLYPIPDKDVQLNPSIVQNPGY